MSRIFYTDAAHTQGIIQHGDMELHGPLPPESAEYRPLWDQLLADGVEPEDYTPPPPPPPAPISDRQFFQQLAIDGVITEDEALATSDGTLPALLEQVIASMPKEHQFGARMTARNATSYERNNPLVGVVAAALGWDNDRLDRLWVEASKL